MWWNDYSRIQFLDKGRDRNGCDCWGLVRLIYKEQLNIDLPSYIYDYKNTDEKELITSIIADHRDLFSTVDKPKPFDLVLLRMLNHPMHIGLVINKDSMIHCHKDVNTTIEEFTSLKWKHRIIGFGRHDGLSDIRDTSPVQ